MADPNLVKYIATYPIIAAPNLVKSNIPTPLDHDRLPQTKLVLTLLFHSIMAASTLVNPSNATPLEHGCSKL